MADLSANSVAVQTEDPLICSAPMANLPRRQGRPSKAEARMLNEHILDVAFASFLREGFDRTSIDGIATECGTTRPSIMRRYQSKGELFMDAALRYRRRATERMWQGITCDDVLDELRVSCRRVLGQGLDATSIAFFRASAANVERIPGLSELTLGWDKEVCVHLEGIILRAQEAGLFQRQSATILAMMAMALMLSYPMNRAMLGDSELQDSRGMDRYFSTAWASFVAMA